jgi:fucose permease
LGWRALFVIFAIVCFLSISALAATPIEEERQDKASSVLACLKLLGRPFILLCFLGIMCHVGIDVGTNTYAPKIVMERLHLVITEASYATGLYFIFRTAGCFLGSFILRVVSPRLFFTISVVMMAIAMALLFFGQSAATLYTGIALIGFGNSNIFSIVFAQALNASPKEKNEVSGLMIMGLFGGTIFPLAMGFAADAMGQAGAVAIMAVGVIYLIAYSLKIKA